MSDADLERIFPLIKWREPLPVTVVDGVRALACRFCIATKGLAAKEVSTLPQTPEEFEQHMKEAHP